MKKIITHVAIFLAGIFSGMLLFKYKLFPVPQLVQLKNAVLPPPSKPTSGHIDKLITTYVAGVPLFSDRSYYDTIGDTRLDSMYVLQIPRHTKFSVEIQLDRRANIYRFLSQDNNNDVFSDWTATDITTFVQGASCTHTSVVFRTFEAGKISLHPGGPVASSPILIEDLSNTSLDMPFTILH